MIRNVLTYLGLGADEEYDDGYFYDDEVEDDDPRRPSSSPAPIESRGHVTSVPPASGGSEGQREGSRSGLTRASRDDSGEEDGSLGAVRPLRPVRSDSGLRSDPGLRRGAEGGRSESGTDSETVRRVAVSPRSRSDEGGSVATESRNEPVVRPVPIQRSKPRALSPQSFSDAKVLADELKANTPVIMNLRDVDRDLARRLIDFASGVCYSTDASMEKLASQVFLLTPESVEVSGEERRRIEERGFDR